MSDLCEGSTAGERRAGYPFWGDAHGGVWTAQQYRDYLQSWLAAALPAQADAFGPGGVRLSTLICPLGSATEPVCGTAFGVVFSTIAPVDGGPDVVRRLLIFHVGRSPAGGMQIERVVTMGPTVDLAPFLRGGAVQGGGPKFFLPGAARAGQFVPWSPPNSAP